MLKLIYRIIILVAVFIAALSYFSGDIKEVVFDLDNTTTMENATFPLVTIRAGESTINLLHGYSSNIDANKVRESVIPLDANKAFELQIDQKRYDIKKINYEVREFVGNALIETSSVSVFEENKGIKTAKIRLQAALEPEKEYALKITLITSKSEKMYFYQRVKIYEDSHLQAKLNFVMEFHNAILNKDTAEGMIKYLEPTYNTDNSTLANVNIHSSFELVSWGNLKPKVLTEIVPTVKEIYADTASVELGYFVQSEVSGVPETYRVTEFYRVRYSTDRMYLLNYERHMESVFDINLADVTKSELKLGITSDYSVPYEAGVNQTKLAFVRDRELWFYDLEKNEITRVFSFCQDNPDYVRDMYDQHNIRIMNMDAEGNINFLVYGYMNRGQYEGKVAVILYHYVCAENRIEELVYIPVDEPYQSLKENIGELSYVNSKDVFYFQLYNTIYSYALITKKLTVVADDISRSQVKVLKDIHYVVWQEDANPKLSDNIYILDMETGRKDTISSKQGYKIRLMDMIDSNIIYGFVKEKDITSMVDGSIIAPLATVEIASVNKKILKSYSNKDYYVSEVGVKDNIIELRRVQKVQQDGRTMYTSVQPDYVMNQEKSEAPIITVISRVTDQAIPEYYLDLPDGFTMGKLPKFKSTVSTIITEDPTVRLPEAEEKLLYYYPYITGGIAGAYENAADAIEIAREGSGVVLSSNQQLVWERGLKSNENTISRFDTMNCSYSPNTSIEAGIKLMLDYQGVQVSLNQLSVQNSSAYDVLKKYSKYTPVRLTGITLEDAFYYISKDRPVLVMTGINKAVIIYGYDTFNITIMDPSTGRKEKIGIQDGAKMFEDAGNIFLSYLGE